MARPSRREHLIETAIALFAKHGYHATGIDKVMEEAGMSKRTLYTYFRSKEELVLAALRHYDSVFRNHFMAKVEKAASTPEGRILAIYDIAEEWFTQQNFYGCMFINAVGEYSEADSPIRQVARDFKKLMRTYLRELVGQLPVADADELANELALLLEGAIVTAQVSGNPAAAHIAKRAAKTLIANALEAPKDAAKTKARV
jgi:AcrR family transcriptional regulator